MIDASSVLPPPYGAWGGYMKYRLSPDVYLHAGAFESNPVDYLKKRHGLDFSTTDAGSLLTASAAAKASNPYSSHYELNGYHNTSRQTDPLTGASEHGSSGAFFKFQQTVWRADGGQGGAPQAAQLFGSLSAAADDKQPFRHFAEAGISWLAPSNARRIGSTSRPATCASTRTSWSSSARAASPPVAPEPGLEGCLRAGRQRPLALTRHLALEPSVQYVFNPDNYYNPGATEISGDGRRRPATDPRRRLAAGPVNHKESAMTSPRRFDYIIVGAGSAGCVLANRLSADPSVSVCLIEAGPSDRSLFPGGYIRTPAGIIRLIANPKWNWMHRFSHATGNGGGGALPARPRLGRLQRHQRDDLHPWPPPRLRPVGRPRQPGLEL